MAIIGRIKVIMTKESIKAIFQNEFGLIADKFQLIDLPVPDLLNAKEDFVWHPGVYVFYSAEKIIKVGRHLINSRKRALEHIRDNTRNEDLEMKNLAIDPNINIRILLINVKNPADAHWVASVEIFLETYLTPLIRSKRLG